MRQPIYAPDAVSTLLERVRLLGVLIEDARTVYQRDPGANHPLEVLLYPGVHALWAHRIASALHQRGHLLLARLCSQLARLLTGVDAHPASTIGRRVFIDHAMGVVIGETAEIGDDVLIYHGVTLGARGVVEGKRHPTVGDGVTLGANATVLGPVSVGDHSTVGAGAVVVAEVPAEATAVGVPATPVDT